MWAVIGIILGWVIGMGVGFSALSGINPALVGGDFAKFVIQLVGAVVVGWILHFIGAILGALIDGGMELADAASYRRRYGKRTTRYIEPVSDQDKDKLIDQMADRAKRRREAIASGTPAATFDAEEQARVEAAAAAEAQRFQERVQIAKEQPPLRWPK